MLYIRRKICPTAKIFDIGKRHCTAFRYYFISIIVVHFVPSIVSPARKSDATAPNTTT